MDWSLKEGEHGQAVERKRERDCLGNDPLLSHWCLAGPDPPHLLYTLSVSLCVAHRLEYCDEAVKDPGQVLPVNIHQPPAFVHKILQLSGILLYYEEFTDDGGDSGIHAPSPAPKV